MRQLWQYYTATHTFHAFKVNEIASLCGIPRGGNPPIAETKDIPREIRCRFCEAIRKQERVKLGVELLA
jgi:rubredoxin